MDFDEISAVVPWIELAADLGQTLDSQQVAEPRCFKTHCWYDHCPKGARYIVVVRDPTDVALSFFNFFQGWFFTPGEVSVSEFVKEFWLARDRPQSDMENASYFHHLISWWKYAQQHPNSVLWVFFEDMKEDLEVVVRRVDKFMGLKSSETTINTAVRHSTFEFMKNHQSQFDEHLSKQRRNVACGLPPTAGMSGSKINQGYAGAAKAALPQDVLNEISRRWEDVVTPVTKCKNYASFREKVHSSTALY